MSESFFLKRCSSNKLPSPCHQHLIKGQFKSFEEPNYIKVLDFTLSNMSLFSRIFSLERFLCENICVKYFPHNYESILFVAVFLPIWNFIQERRSHIFCSMYYIYVFDVCSHDFETFQVFFSIYIKATGTVPPAFQTHYSSKLENFFL